jgi:hypothetical protein
MSIVVSTSGRANRPSRPAASQVSTQQQSKKKKKNNQAKRKQRRRQQRNVRVASGKTTVLSQCADDYMHAMTDPFGFRTTGRYPCVPDIIDIPSQKFTFTQRGTTGTGPNGIGFIIVSPFSIGASANAKPWIACSNGNATPTNFVNFPSAGGADISEFHVSASPQQTDAVQNFRPVAVGLRMRFIGQEIARGGTVTPFCTGFPINGAPIAQALSFGDNEILVPNANRSWQGTFFRPMTQDGTRYQNTSYSAYVQGVMGIAYTVPTAAAGVASYEFEVTGYWECTSRAGATGQILTDITKSDSDLEGLSKVRGFISNFNTSQVGQAVYQQARNYVVQAAMAYMTGNAGGIASSLSDRRNTLAIEF